MAALIHALRREFDRILNLKIDDPSINISDNPILALAIELLDTDGLGN